MAAAPDDLKTIAYRASAAYRRKLADARKAARERGVRSDTIDTDPKLVEHLATVAAFAVYGVKLPHPTGKKHGGARTGAGRKAGAKAGDDDGTD